ncbi:MFS transporter [Enemella sp. A6]|uniref:MFS transporter n=1 Tax=Enemella sp. A6 TaxID=3440152 RepID=UPI003EB7246A
MSAPTERAPQPPAFAVIGLLALAGLIVTILQTMIVPLIPELPAILGVSPADASWMVTATLVAGAVSTPALSRLADMFGKRRMLVVSMGLVVLGSALVVVTGSFAMAVLGRALQGMGIAVVPIAMGVMRDLLPAERLPGAVAMMSAMFGIGGAVGLPASGLIYHAWGWDAIFLVLGGVGALLMLGFVLLIPPLARGTGGRFDWPGAVFLSIGLIGLLLAITKSGEWGWLTSRTGTALVIGVIGFAIFIPWVLRRRDPLVDLATATRRPVLLANIAACLISFAMYVNMLTTTQMLQVPREGFGMNAATAGLGMLPAALLSVVLAPLAAWLMGRIGARATMLIGASVLGFGYLMRIVLVEHAWMVIVGAAGLSLGSSIALATMPVLIMQEVPMTQTAAANGLNSLIRSIGTSTSSATVAAILAASTTMIAGVLVPSPGAFATVHLLAGLSALTACALVFFVPRRPVPGRG